MIVENNLVKEIIFFKYFCFQPGHGLLIICIFFKKSGFSEKYLNFSIVKSI